MSICHMIWITPFSKINSIEEFEYVSTIPEIDCKCMETVVKKSDLSQIWLWSWQTFTNLPSGIIQKNAADFIDLKMLLDSAYYTTDKKANLGNKMKLAQLADLLRYLVLEKYGGWYIDTDIILCHPLPTDKPYMFATSPNKMAGAFKRKKSYHVTNCAIYISEKNSLIMREIINDIYDYINKNSDIGDYKNFCKFMDMLETKIYKHKLEKYIVDSSVFCPMPWFAKYLWKRRVISNSFCYNSQVYTEKDILIGKHGILGVHLFSTYRTDKYVIGSSVDIILNKMLH